MEKFFVLMDVGLAREGGGHREVERKPQELSFCCPEVGTRREGFRYAAATNGVCTWVGDDSQNNVQRYHQLNSSAISVMCILPPQRSRFVSRRATHNAHTHQGLVSHQHERGLCRCLVEQPKHPRLPTGTAAAFFRIISASPPSTAELETTVILAVYLESRAMRQHARIKNNDTTLNRPTYVAPSTSDGPKPSPLTLKPLNSNSGS